MADQCLCSLVVLGRIDEVRRFVRAARPLPPKKPRRNVRPTDMLSFERLLPRGDLEDVTDLYGTPSWEPEDCWFSGIKRVSKTSGSASYKFLTKWSEPDALVRHVSRENPRLEFVLGAVAAATWEASSVYFRKGRRHTWRLAEARVLKMYRAIYAAAGVDTHDDAIDEDLELSLDVEFDHAQMDVVMAHWTAERRRRVWRKKRD